MGLPSSVCFRFVALVAFVACAASALVACPPPAASDGDAGSPGTPVATCNKANVPCQFAPGKIGMCVERPAPCDETRQACFQCQSQH